jgi:uncharacterized phiE125 gp8 family phage protein
MGITINWANWQTWQSYAYRVDPRYPHAISVCTVQPTEEPITLEQAKLRAGLSWTSGGSPADPRDDLMLSFIKAARSKVEHDTGLALITQTRDVYFDAVRGTVIVLPWQCMPLQAVTSIETIDTAGAVHVMDPASYVVDGAGGRIALAQGASWPSNLRAFQPWTITLVAGWEDAATLAADAPALTHAVGLLTAHYATTGRDVVLEDRRVIETPQGYAQILEPYLPITLV